MASRDDGTVTYAPRTFSFCPVTTAANFESGFAACSRLASGIFAANSSTMPSVADPTHSNFVQNSIAWNYTDRKLEGGVLAQACSMPYDAISTSHPQGLSCVSQVRLAPFVLPGGNDDSFFTCTREAQVRAPFWPEASNIAEAAVVMVLVGFFFAIPVLAIGTILFVRWRTARRIERSDGQVQVVSGAPASSAPKKVAPAEPAAQAVEGGGGGEAGRVYLSFSDVYYSVPLNSAARKNALASAKATGVGKKDMPKFWDTKPIIKGVSGAFSPGTLSAIMGPSGCGKSTLLNVVADRIRSGNASGRILLNGQPRGKCFKRACAYVMQFDALFACLTVREMLAYTAEMRVEGSDARGKAERVERVIRELDLNKVADSTIGGGGRRGISGGQARRVTVGVELVTQPSVLFLDEPTTGLDAYSSLLLVRALRRLADSGRTVLCTIHQPRPDIFALFDTLLLMSAGEVAYFGPRSAIATYLGGAGISLPTDVNPADFVVDLTYARDEERVVDKLVASWRDSAEGRRMDELVASLSDGTLPGLGVDFVCVEEAFDAGRAGRAGKAGEAGQTGEAGKAGAKKSSEFAQPLRRQIYSLARRAYTNTLRSPDFFRRMLLFPLLQYLFFGLLYLGTRWNHERLVAAGFTTADAGLENFQQLIAQKRSFYFQVMSTAILTESSVMAEAYDEQRAFRREHAAGAYSIVSYHAQWAVRLNFRAIIKSALFGSLVYFFPAHAPNQFGDDTRVFIFFLVTLCICSTVGSALALLFISLIPDAEGAAGAHNAIAAVLLQYSGYYLLPCLMPPLVNTAYFISFGK